MAAIQLGNASLALAAAAKLNGNLPEAEAALRHAVSELRWVLGVSAADMKRLGSSNSKVEVSVCGCRALSILWRKCGVTSRNHNWQLWVSGYV